MYERTSVTCPAAKIRNGASCDLPWRHRGGHCIALHTSRTATRGENQLSHEPYYLSASVLLVNGGQRGKKVFFSSSQESCYWQLPVDIKCKRRCGAKPNQTMAPTTIHLATMQPARQLNCRKSTSTTDLPPDRSSQRFR